jgi:hypothetical protein
MKRFRIVLLPAIVALVLAGLVQYRLYLLGEPYADGWNAAESLMAPVTKMQNPSGRTAPRLAPETSSSCNSLAGNAKVGPMRNVRGAPRRRSRVCSEVLPRSPASGGGTQPKGVFGGRRHIWGRFRVWSGEIMAAAPAVGGGAQQATGHQGLKVAEGEGVGA